MREARADRGRAAGPAGRATSSPGWMPSMPHPFQRIRCLAPLPGTTPDRSFRHMTVHAVILVGDARFLVLGGLVRILHPTSNPVHGSRLCQRALGHRQGGRFRLPAGLLLSLHRLRRRRVGADANRSDRCGLNLSGHTSDHEQGFLGRRVQLVNLLLPLQPRLCLLQPAVRPTQLLSTNCICTQQATNLRTARSSNGVWPGRDNWRRISSAFRLMATRVNQSFGAICSTKAVSALPAISPN